MVEVVVFHSALGLRPAVTAFADPYAPRGIARTHPTSSTGKCSTTWPRESGSGTTSGSRNSCGARTSRWLPCRPTWCSPDSRWETGAAEYLTATHPGARGAVLMHGAFEPAAFGIAAWPGVPLQLHHVVGDGQADLRAVHALEVAARSSFTRLLSEVAADRPECTAARFMNEYGLASRIADAPWDE